MLLLLRFFYIFLLFLKIPKKRDFLRFLRFLPCFTRFLELWPAQGLATPVNDF